MKKDLMLIAGMPQHLMEVYSALRLSKITVIHAENAYDAKARLEMHSPAFVLLDFDIEGANFLLSRKIVTMRGEPVALTRKEYEVLCLLAKHAGTIFTKQRTYVLVCCNLSLFVAKILSC